MGDLAATMRHLEELRSLGFNIFNVKAGDDPDGDIKRLRALAENVRPNEILIVDANGAWRVDTAVYVMASLADCPKLYFEQPCASYADCLAVRRRLQSRIILDESVKDVAAVLKAREDGVADAITMKINNVGGLSKARLVRDLCAELALPLIIQDSWGSQITDATIAHLGHSTPPSVLLAGWCSIGHCGLETVENPSPIVAGQLSANEGPGLGIRPRWSVIGKPLQTFE